MAAITFLLFSMVFLVVLVTALGGARTGTDPDAPSKAHQLLRLVAVLFLCSGLTGAGWWMSGQGVGLSEDFGAQIEGDLPGQGVRGTNVRHGSRRGRHHRGRGLHGGK